MELRPGSHVLITGASRGKGRAVVEAVEPGKRAGYHLPAFRVLRSAHGRLLPRLADVVLRRLRGLTAALRR